MAEEIGASEAPTRGQGAPNNKEGALVHTTRNLGKGLAVLRIAVGAGFLYAGLDKVMHFAGVGKAFSATGFLKGATLGAAPGSVEGAVVNPTHDFWVSLAGNPGLMGVINFLVVFGEIAIGVALILGIATRFAGVLGGLMMGLFYVATWDFSHGFVTEQFLYGIIALFVAYAAAGEAYGIDAILDRTPIVRSQPKLRYVLG
jgi:thiosulfate dehydrogenase [quinone] large subunit